MRTRLLGLIALSLSLANPCAQAQGEVARSTGQQLYLPIYSHIWHGDTDAKGEPVKTLVSVAVSVRNTDPDNPIEVTSAQYYNTEGKKLREYVPAAKTIPAMGTFELFIPRSDDSGGSGANFVIAWRAKVPASPPVVEGIHANLPAARAIVFTTSARPIPR